MDHWVNSNLAVVFCCLFLRPEANVDTKYSMTFTRPTKILKSFDILAAKNFWLHLHHPPSFVPEEKSISQIPNPYFFKHPRNPSTWTSKFPGRSWVQKFEWHNFQGPTFSHSWWKPFLSFLSIFSPFGGPDLERATTKSSEKDRKLSQDMYHCIMYLLSKYIFKMTPSPH